MGLSPRVFPIPIPVTSPMGLASQWCLQGLRVAFWNSPSSSGAGEVSPGIFRGPGASRCCCRQLVYPTLWGLLLTFALAVRESNYFNLNLIRITFQGPWQPKCHGAAATSEGPACPAATVALVALHQPGSGGERRLRVFAANMQ